MQRSPYELDSGFELRPTLIIGLGGTGHKVAVHLKARFLNTTNGEDVVNKVIKFQVFDTDDRRETAPLRNGGTIGLEKDEEFTVIGHVPTGDIIRYLDRHPAIAAWLPRNLPSRAITAGAQQFRPLGRLALFYHFEDIKGKVGNAIQNLTQLRLRGELQREGIGVTQERGVNVFIISSVCGGTGSGTFLDMAYLVRHWLEAQNVQEAFCFVNGVLVMPQAFRNVSGANIGPNAFAALRELDHFTQEGDFRVTYPDGETVQYQRRPFNICYLLDASNEESKSLAGLEQLAPIAAEAIFQQVASQTGEANKSAFDNVHILTQEDDGHLTAYSSFSTAEWVLPVEQLQDMTSTRLAATLADRLRGAAPHDATVQEAVEAISQRLRLETSVLQEELGRDDNGRQIRIHLDPAPLSKASTEEIPRRAENMVSDYEAVWLTGEYLKIAEKNQQRLRGQWEEAITQETQRLMDDPYLGLQAGGRFLERLADRLGALGTAFSRQRDDADQRVRTSQGRLREARDNLDKAANSFFLTRSSNVKTALGQYVTAADQYCGSWFESRRLGLAAQLAQDVRTFTLDLRRKVTELSARLERLTTSFTADLQQARETMRAGTRVGQFILFDPGDDDAAYARHMSDLNQATGRFVVAVGGVSQLANLDEQQLGQRFLDYAHQVFAPLYDARIEDIIQEKENPQIPRTTAAQRLEELRRTAAPLWSYFEAKLRQDLRPESIFVIGVENRETSIYVGANRPGESLASTHDPHRVTVLHTKHGLPLFAIRQYDAHRERYQALLRRRTPLHLFPNFGQDDSEAKTYFALGQVFGHITHKGTYYLCRPSLDKLDPDVRLAQGLGAAIDAFIEKPEYVNVIKTLVEGQIAQIGNAAAAAKIAEYIEAPIGVGGDIAQLQQELKRLARDYREKLL